VIGLLVDLTLCLPFFWGMCLRRPRGARGVFTRAHWLESVLALARIVLGLVLFLVVTAQYLSWRALSGVTAAVFVLSGILFYTFGGRVYRRLERRFLGQLRRNEIASAPLAPWDAHLTELTVDPESPACGMTLEELGLEGALIARITRGRRQIVAPGGTDVIFPHDRLWVLGRDAEIERLRARLASADLEPAAERPLGLHSVLLAPHSRLCGRTVRDSGIRELVDGLLVGVERDGERRLHPPPDLRLEAGDRLWIVGDPARMGRLNG
jgi:CPA2 family monovalent cation:H+ antiporter-2